MDATDCRIQEPSPFSKSWYSHKFHGPGLRYEIALSIHSGNIVWVHGGVPCGQCNDLGLARQDFVHNLDLNETVIADLGYHDNNHFQTPLTSPTASLSIQSRIRARHETINSRLKNFNVLSHEFRHSLPFHVECFHAVANIVHLNMVNGEPLFEL